MDVFRFSSDTNPHPPPSPPSSRRQMDAATAPIYLLPEDVLLQIFSSLSLRQIIVCRSVSKFFYQLLTSPSFVHHLFIPSAFPPLRLIALRPPHHHHHHRQASRYSSPPQQSSSVLHAFDPSEERWLRFSLEFLPFRSLHPVAASSLGLVYLWGDSIDSAESCRSLIACNPLTHQFKVFLLHYTVTPKSNYFLVANS